MSSKNYGNAYPSDPSPSALLRIPGNHFIDWVIVPVVLAAILLLGHYGLFLEQSVLTEQDPATVMAHSTLHEGSNGWRPDVGLGTSFFFGDPGGQHTWSVLRWWDHLFSDDILTYSISIIAFLWMACFSQYWLLRVAVPDLGRVTSILLASMLAFGSLRNEFFFSRLWTTFSIIIVPISLILYDFLKRPSFRHYFLYTLTLCFALFLGSFASLYQGLLFSIVFFLILSFHKGLHKNLGELWGDLKRYILLTAASGVTMVFLGAWTFYSIILEKSLVGYVRDPDYSAGVFFTSLSLPAIINKLFGYVHAGIFSNWTSIMGLGQTLNLQPWNMVSPLLPIVLLLTLFYKSRNFWEFASKYVVFGFLIYQELVELCPGILGAFQSILNLYPPSKFQPVIQAYEIVLIGILLHRIQTQNLTISLRGINVARCAGVFLSAIYAGLLIIACLAVLSPQTLKSILHFSYNWSAQFIPFPAQAKALLPVLISENVRLFNETMGAADIIFYGLTFILSALFATPYWLNILGLARGRLFASLLLVNSLLLAWTVYPLNKEVLIWDRQKKDGVNLSEIFEPTDRIAKHGGVGCRSRKDFVACVEERIFKGEFGPRRYQVGYILTPTLEFSRVKSFTQKEVAAMMDAFMQREGKNDKGYRRILQGYPNYFPSKLYDFSAVNYFISPNRQPEHEQLELVHASQQFYLYRNLEAWPYYYLADRIDIIENYDDLYEAEKGVAYFWKDSNAPVFPAKNNGSNGRIELESFEFGEMVFLTASLEDEVLVVNDAWHPYWKAEIDQEAVPIIKTNGVLKGVAVPPGNHRVRLFFDNTPYRPGIWISLLSWMGFISLWFWVARRTKAQEKL